MNQLANSIVDTIKKFGHRLYIVVQRNGIDCSCVDFTTKQPSHICSKCLGTGKEVAITQAIGIRQDTGKTNIRGYNLSEYITSNVFYVLSKTKLNIDNIIVDDKEVFVVQRVAEKYGDKTDSPIYYLCECVPKKNYKDAFYSMFIKMIGGGRT